MKRTSRRSIVGAAAQNSEMAAATSGSQASSNQNSSPSRPSNISEPSEPEADNSFTSSVDGQPEPNQPPTFSMDTDISTLEAPTFTTLDRSATLQTINSLDWDHKLNLIGMKMVNATIHTCEICQQPILIYGRMIPCKHVFCISCARTSILPTTNASNENSKDPRQRCHRCRDPVSRVDPARLGAVFLCEHGDGECKRTYMSQRDLDAHFQHRHMKQQKQEDKSASDANTSGSSASISNSSSSSRRQAEPSSGGSSRSSANASSRSSNSYHRTSSSSSSRMGGRSSHGHR